MGAAVGVTDIGKHEISIGREIVGKRLQEVIGNAQKLTEESAVRASKNAYKASGAFAGILAGGKYALLCLWWWASEDEIKMRLLQASPVKYREPKELDFRGIAANYAPPVSDIPALADHAIALSNGKKKTPVPRPSSYPSSRSTSRPSSRSPSADFTNPSRQQPSRLNADSPRILA